MLDTAKINNDLSRIITDMPTTAVIGGISYSVRKTSLRRDHVMAQEGLRDVYSFSIILQQRNLVAVPEPGDEITIAAVTYRVLDTNLDPTETILRLDLGEQYANG